MKTSRNWKIAVALCLIAVLFGVAASELSLQYRSSSPGWIDDVVGWQQDETTVYFNSPQSIMKVLERSDDDDSDGDWDAYTIVISRWAHLAVTYGLLELEGDNEGLIRLHVFNDDTGVATFDDDGDSIPDRMLVSLGGLDGTPTRYVYSDFGIDGSIDKAAFFQDGVKQWEFIVSDLAWYPVVQNPPDGLYGETIVKQFNATNPDGVDRTVVFQKGRWIFSP